MSDVLLISIPNNKLGDIKSSSNYKPVAFATAISKNVEYVILNRFCNTMDSSDIQFGFGRYQSTDLRTYLRISYKLLSCVKHTYFCFLRRH